MSRIDQQFADTIKSIGETMAHWATLRDRYEPIIAKLEDFGAEPTYSGWLYASITGNRDKLVKVIRALRTSGLKSYLHPKEGSPEFRALYESDDKALHVYLTFTSTVCKRIKIGTKTETVDVYEVQCGEEPIDESTAEPEVAPEVKTEADDISF